MENVNVMDCDKLTDIHSEIIEDWTFFTRHDAGEGDCVLPADSHVAHDKRVRNSTVSTSSLVDHGDWLMKSHVAHNEHVLYSDESANSPDDHGGWSTRKQNVTMEHGQASIENLGRQTDTNSGEECDTAGADHMDPRQSGSGSGGSEGYLGGWADVLRRNYSQVMEDMDDHPAYYEYEIQRLLEASLSTVSLGSSDLGYFGSNSDCDLMEEDHSGDSGQSIGQSARDGTDDNGVRHFMFVDGEHIPQESACNKYGHSSSVDCECLQSSSKDWRTQDVHNAETGDNAQRNVSIKQAGQSHENNNFRMKPEDVQTWLLSIERETWTPRNIVTVIRKRKLEEIPDTLAFSLGNMYKRRRTGMATPTSAARIVASDTSLDKRQSVAAEESVTYSMSDVCL